MNKPALVRRRIHDKSDSEKLAYFLGQTTADHGDCRLWAGFVQRNGYAKTRLGGRSEWVHRLVFVLAGGNLPDGVDVCHRCDVRHCISPHHLFAGSRLDNMRDAVSKGRQARGSALPHTKLFSHRDLLARAQAGESYEAIARDLNVSSQLVSRIARQNGIFRHRKHASALALVERMIAEV